MVKTKSINEIAEKWEDVTPGRASYYEKGVKDPKKDWAEEASKQEDAYEAGVTGGIARKAFGKGVRKAGTATWTEGTLEKGISRYGPGVRAGKDRYSKNFAPFVEEIERIQLPERRARGDPANIERVAKMADALRKKKLELSG